jgi:hypothetical protein
MTTLPPYELRIGVTGHRALADAAAVAVAVDRLLDHIARVLDRPGTPLVWTVISPLAKGADRIVARAVLDRPHARLQVITPLAIDDYVADFTDEKDRLEFDDLLARRDSLIELRGLPRDRAYRRVGEQVVDACEILIAIWDGESSRGTGGTADIIDYARRRERTVLKIDATNPNGPVRLLKPDGGEGECPGTRKALSRGYHQQSAYVADQGASHEAVEKNRAGLVAGITSAAREAKLPLDTVVAVLSQLGGPYSRADVLAAAYQKKYRRATHAILYLAAAAVTFGVAQVLFFAARPSVILLEIAAMLGVLFAWRYSLSEAWHEKWLHDRYLAERIRAEIFLAFLGPQASGARADEDSLPFYPGPHQWLNKVAHGLRSRVPDSSAVSIDGVRAFLIDAWLNVQVRFHDGKAERVRRQAHRRHRLGLVLFGATLLMATLHLLGVGHADASATPVRRVDLWITFLALVLPAWAASVHAVTGQLELDRIAVRSERMATMLRLLARRAAQAESLPALGDVASDAAKLMGQETREWWALLSFQDVKLHV